MADAIEKWRNLPGSVAMRNRLNNIFTFNPKTENALRNMEEEKLCKILAARPELIPPQNWTSTPEMYDLYVRSREQLGLPATVEEAVAQNVDIRDPMTNKTVNARQAVLKDMGMTEEQFNNIIKSPEATPAQPFDARAAALKDMGYTKEQFDDIIKSPSLVGVPKTDPRVQVAETTSPGKSFGVLAGDKLNEFGDYMSGQFDRLTKKPEGVVPASNIRKYTSVGSPVDYNGTIESAMASRDQAFNEFKNAQKAWSDGELDQSAVDALWNKFSRLDALVDKTQKNPRSQESVADAKAVALGDSYNPKKEYPPYGYPTVGNPDTSMAVNEGAPKFGAESSSYDRFIRPKASENATVEQIRAQELEFNQGLKAALRDVKKNLASQASSPVAHDNAYDPLTGAILPSANSDEARYTPAQMKQVQAQREEAKLLYGVFNTPEAEKILYANPQILMLAQADPKAAAKELDRIVKGGTAPTANVAGVSSISGAVASPSAAYSMTPGGNETGPMNGPVSPNPMQSSVGGGNEYGNAAEIPYEDAELASVRRSVAAAPKVSPRAETGSSAPYRGPTTVVDPLTRKAYSPIGQTPSPSYRDDSSIQRSGPSGEESPLDFIRNSEIYQKRLAEQPPMEARGGPISHGGSPIDAKCHTGIIHMAVGGRTDHLPMNVYANSYVLPADVVSGLGEGNTLAGAKIIDHMFSGPSLQRLANKTVKDPLRRASGGEASGDSSSTVTYSASPSGFSLAPGPKLNFQGMDMMGMPFGAKQVDTRAAAPRYPDAKYSWRYNQPKPGEKPTAQMARGGYADDRLAKPVEIIAAGGEYVVPPEVVRALGHGDADRGHEWLDTFVKSSRSHIIKTMKNLPGPKKD